MVGTPNFLTTTSLLYTERETSSRASSNKPSLTMKNDSIVLYPAPGMGHVIAMVELAKLILLNHHSTNLSITIILITGSSEEIPAVVSYIQFISQSNPSITFHHLPLIHESSITAAITSAKPPSRAAVSFEMIRVSTNTHLLSALQDISQTSTICSLVIDFFCNSALPIARHLRIPTFYFFTSGATILSCFLYFPILHKQINKSFKDLTTTYLQFPGMPPFRASHMAEPLLDRDDPAYADFTYSCENLPNSDGIIVNTFDDLEPIALDVIASGKCLPDDAIIPPMYYIGPLIAVGPNDEKKESSIDVAKYDIMSWLDAQPKRSVVYLCFGSRGRFAAAQLKEIANGLEKSCQRFLWVVKSPPGSDYEKDLCLDDLLPEGFLERTKDRGVVVKKWAPQVAVLGHESIGGFVTHCGWNSVLESVVAGVPMVTWPLYAEQHLNKAILVENMKMAIPLDEREEDGIVSATELEKRVRELMESEVGKELRERSWKMRERALAAWGEFGSSTTALKKLVQLWKHG